MLVEGPSYWFGIMYVGITLRETVHKSVHIVQY